MCGVKRPDGAKNSLNIDVNRMLVVRISIAEATKILTEFFEKKFKDKIMLDWMPHELNRLMYNEVS